MSAFSSIERPEVATPPAHTRVVPPTVFASTFKGRPTSEVCAGFRALSEDDLTFVSQDAAKRAWEAHPQPLDEELRIAAYNACVLRTMVARGTCDPNDCTKPWDMWKGAPDLNVHTMLTHDGARFLFAEVERATILASPLRAEATDADMLTLFAVLTDALPKVPHGAASRVRRMLAYALDEVTPHVTVTDA